MTIALRARSQSLRYRRRRKQLLRAALVLLGGACAPQRPLPPPTAPYQRSATPAGPVSEPAAAPATTEPAPSARPPERALAVEHGEATYYSDRLAGRKTASGKRYDPKALTAAHRKLPFGTRVRVVRTDKPHSVTVTITDRGPFGGRSRIIDVSKAAAKRLDMLRAGVVPVRLEILEYGK